MDQIKIGAFLKSLRNEKKMTQEEIAEYFGVSVRTVSRWETGSNMPDMSLISELSDFYGVDIRELLAGEKKTDRDLPLLSINAEYAKIDISLSFWGNNARELVTDILNIEPNDPNVLGDPNTWSFSAASFNGRIISPAFDSLTALIMKCNFPYIATRLKDIRRNQYLKSRITLNIQTREHIPFMLFTQDIIQFMYMTDTEFKVRFLFNESKAPGRAIFEGKSRFKLIIKGEELELDALTSELRLGPGFIRKKEDFSSASAQDMWIFETQYRDVSEVSVSMRSFADILTGKEDVVKALKASHKCSSAVDVVLYITEHYHEFEFNLNRDIIRFAAETESGLGFDIY